MRGRTVFAEIPLEKVRNERSGDSAHACVDVITCSTEVCRSDGLVLVRKIMQNLLGTHQTQYRLQETVISPPPVASGCFSLTVGSPPSQ